jgi:hypothetical protein
MANRSAIEANLTIRFVVDVGGIDTTPLNYTAARTFEVTNANTAFLNSVAGQTTTLGKAGATIGTFASTGAAGENIRIGTVAQANSNFVSGDVLRLSATAAALTMRTYVQILPSVTAAS